MWLNDETVQRRVEYGAEYWGYLRISDSLEGRVTVRRMADSTSQQKNTHGQQSVSVSVSVSSLTQSMLIVAQSMKSWVRHQKYYANAANGANNASY